MSSAENQSPKSGWESMPNLAFERIAYNENSRSENNQTVSDILGDIQRLDETIIELTPVLSHEILDDDRRDEIIDRLRHISDLDDSEWLEPGERFPEIQWSVLEDEKPDKQNLFSDLRSKYKPAGNLLKVTVERPVNMPFHPGDYFPIKLPETPDIDIERYDIPEICNPYRESEWRVYSAGSRPGRDEIDFYVKVIPDEKANNTSLTPVMKPKLDYLDEILLKAPRKDEISIIDNSDRDIQIFADTGTGMSPNKSIIETIDEHNLDEHEGGKNRIQVFDCTQFKDELPSSDYFEELDKRKDNFRYVPILTREQSLSDWKGETDYIQEVVSDYLTEENIDIDNLEVYACGNNLMIDALTQILEDEGLNKNFYQSEAFY